MQINSISTVNQIISITPNHPADIHILYETLNESHRITMATSRKVEIGNQKTRISIKLTIQVTEITPCFENNALFVRGMVINEVENVKIGSFHNLEITLNDSFNLHVVKDLKKTSEQLLKKIDVFLIVIFRNKKFDIAAVDEFGLRNKGSFKQKEIKKFLQENCKTQEIGKKQFPIKSAYKIQYIVSNHELSDFQISNIPKHKIEIEKNDEKKSISEIFENLLLKQKNTKIPFLKDLILANNFLHEYQKAGNKFVIGKKDVFEAKENSAIETLIVTKKLFFSFDPNERLEIRNLINSIQKSKKVVIISDTHLCGKKLNEIGGIGAILSYDYRACYL